MGRRSSKRIIIMFPYSNNCRIKVTPFVLIVLFNGVYIGRVTQCEHQ